MFRNHFRSLLSLGLLGGLIAVGSSDEPDSTEQGKTPKTVKEMSRSELERRVMELQERVDELEKQVGDQDGEATPKNGRVKPGETILELKPGERFRVQDLRVTNPPWRVVVPHELRKPRIPSELKSRLHKMIEPNPDGESRDSPTDALQLRSPFAPAFRFPENIERAMMMDGLSQEPLEQSVPMDAGTRLR